MVKKQEFLSKEEQESLRELEKLASLRESEGYKDLLLPFLRDKVQNSWVDPRGFKSDEEYAFAMKVAWGLAQASQEIMNWVEQRYQECVGLRNKADGKDREKSFAIGT